MTEAIFTSRHTGAALPQRMLDLFDQAGALVAAGRRVDLQVMCFAFTDARIAARLVALCRDHPGLTLRIIADWSQSARGAPTVLAGMAAEGLGNLFIKFKLDAPYRTDEAGRLHYSYGASWGMLHHKTFLVEVDGVPQSMALGSYNWSARGQQAYENLLVTEEPAILSGFAAEFAALWGNHRLTAATDRARHIMARLKDEARAGRDLRAPDVLAGVLGISDPLAPAPVVARQVVDAEVMAAFSGSCPAGAAGAGGHAPQNDRRSIDLLRPSGVRRQAPLTLNTLALDALRAVPGGATLRVAMYALSSRVPEFAELLNAARRGALVRVLLDGRIGAQTATSLRSFAAREGLPIEVQTTRRRMHQKYLCCAETGMVMTGTANMTEDATLRHSDHRVLWRDAPALAGAFAEDFDAISARLAPPLRAAA